jgi:hypothetical protein
MLDQVFHSLRLKDKEHPNRPYDGNGADKVGSVSGHVEAKDPHVSHVTSVLRAWEAAW